MHCYTLGKIGKARFALPAIASPYRFTPDLVTRGGGPFISPHRLPPEFSAVDAVACPRFAPIVASGAYTLFATCSMQYRIYLSVMIGDIDVAPREAAQLPNAAMMHANLG